METQLTKVCTSAARRCHHLMIALLAIVTASGSLMASPEERMYDQLHAGISAWNLFSHETDRSTPPEETPKTVALSCLPNVNISLGQQGYAVLTAVGLVNAPDYPPFQYDVDIMGPLNDTVFCDQLGQEIMVVVTELPTGNSCMSTIFVEDKLRPTLVCTSDTLPCNVNIAEIDFESLLESATDNCDEDVDVWHSYVIQNLPCNPHGFTQQILVTWTATDNYGNSTTCQDVVFLKKPNIGQIVFPPDISVSCINVNIDPEVTGEPTFNGEPIPHTCQYTVGHSDAEIPMCNGAMKILRTWTVRDWCTSAVRTDVQEILIVDNTPPNITCPPSITVNANSGGCTYKYTFPTPTVTDACADPSEIDIDVIVAGVPGIFSPGQMINLGLGTSIITMRATDPCGNTRICQYNVTVRDTDGPVISCPPDLTVSCNESTTPDETGTAVAVDICDLSPTITYTDVTTSVPGSCAFGYKISRTWKATDDSGNTSCCTQMISFTDDVPPVITCPSNVTINCTDSTAPGATGTATATDVCDLAPAVTFTDATVAGSCPQERTINRTWSASDDCGNTSTCLQVISVQDNTPPVIDCPPNVTVMCGDDTAPGETGFAGAEDACDPSPEVTFSDVTTTGGGPQQFNVNRTWMAEDACGNVSTCLQIIIVFDETPPVITCPSNVTIGCTDSTLPAANGSATATDNCDDTPSITFTDVTTQGGCPQESNITRTWIAQDDCGNSATCVQTISVQDNNAPVISCPVNVTVGCTDSTAPAATGSATATDECDANVTIVSNDVTIAGSCPQERTINRTWSATDDCGNVSTCLQVISVQDNDAPAITCPLPVTISCDESSAPSNTGMATATDECDANPNITFQDVDETPPGGCPEEALISRVWFASDDCGNQITCIQPITIQDNTAPVITCPEDVTIDCSAGTSPDITGEATAEDNCDPEVDITFSDEEVDGGNPNCDHGTIERTWVATDNCGNSSTCLQIIQLIDEEDPTIDCPADIQIACDESTLPANTGEPTGFDACDATLEFTFDDEVTGGACPEESTISRTWTATDECGNTATCIQIITIVDDQAPSVICPDDVTIDCGDSTDPDDTGVATADDTCDDDVDLTFEDEISGGGCPDEQTITRTWIATDNCGNVATCIQVIIVEDGVAPLVSCPDDVVIECTESSDPSNTGEATAEDNCGNDVDLTFDDEIVGDCPGTATINRTWSAVDACGNAGTCLQVIQLTDETAPLCVAQNITISLNGNGMVTILPEDVDNGSSDECGPVTLSVSPDTFDCEDEGENEVTFTVTDCAGNSCSTTVIVFIEDTGGLEALCQDILIFVDANGNASVNPEDVDNGSGGGCTPGDLEYDLSQTDFDCSDLGPNIVVLTVTDQDGNTATCTAIITVADNIPPTIDCPDNVTVDCHVVTNPDNTSQFGTATGDDNCDVVVITETHVINLNDCNVGTIIRTFTATDGAGNTATCTQTVTVTNPNPLDAGDITWPPSPISVNICNSTDPEDLPNGFPVINPNALLCADVEIDFTDNVMMNVDNNPNTPCMVITRTWTVVDACQVNGTFTFVQTINVQDPTPPVFTNINDMTKTANAQCVAFFTLIANATDCAGVSITNNSPYGVNTGANASGNYPIGETVVIFTATDGCGNISTMDVVITVIDPNPTQFMCEKHIFFLPEELEITIAAREFVSFLDGGCTDEDDVVVSYSGTMPYDSLRTYDCGDVGVTTFSLWLWSADGSMIVDSCNTADLDLRDPDDLCEDGLVLDGEIENELNIPVPDVVVYIENTPMADTTDRKGRYKVSGLEEDTGYMVTPVKDVDHRAGVSTLDLVAIQKHLLDREKLNSPYKMIAADANRSNNISVLDLLEIRKLILGIYKRFPNNTSWRFIDINYEFPDRHNPFSPGFPESVWLDSVVQGVARIDFVGIKIGDVNGSWFSPVTEGDIKPRSDVAYWLEVKAQHDPVLGNAWVITADAETDVVEGMQWSILTGPLSAGQLEGITSDVIPAGSWYYDAELETVHVSYSPAEPVSLYGLIVLRIPMEGREMQQPMLDETRLTPEAYTTNGEEMDIREIRLRAIESEIENSDAYHLYQNIPNPFSEGTLIRFALPREERVQLLVHDVTGRIVVDRRVEGREGLNEIQITSDELRGQGIYYYTLQSGQVSLTRKMSHTNN